MEVTKETLQKLIDLGIRHINMPQGHKLTEEEAQSIIESVSKIF